jgi:hypothetical protein
MSSTFSLPTRTSTWANSSPTRGRMASCPLGPWRRRKRRRPPLPANERGDLLNRHLSQVPRGTLVSPPPFRVKWLGPPPAGALSGPASAKRGVYVRAGMDKCPPDRFIQSLTRSTPNEVGPVAMSVADRRCYLDRATCLGPIHQFDPISMVELWIRLWSFRGGTPSAGAHRIGRDKRHISCRAQYASTGPHKLLMATEWNRSGLCQRIHSTVYWRMVKNAVLLPTYLSIAPNKIAGH